MSDAAIEAVLRRDRVIVAAAVVVLTALAWAYVWWLAADMDVGGMDMSDFRAIPAGMGLMMPATAPSPRQPRRAPASPCRGCLADASPPGVDTHKGRSWWWGGSRGW